MRLVRIILPTTEGHNRVATFYENLQRNMRNLSISPDQIDFYASGEMGIPTENGSREKVDGQAFIVFLHEPQLADSVTQVIQTALAETWPEREDLLVIETAMRDGRKLDIIRGGKQ